jgi:hypothetical protein
MLFIRSAASFSFTFVVIGDSFTKSAESVAANAKGPTNAPKISNHAKRVFVFMSPLLVPGRGAIVATTRCGEEVTPGRVRSWELS